MRGRQVMLRVMARCTPGSAAATLQQELLAALASFQAQARGTPERYWKMPELCEFTLIVPGAAHFPAITALCSTGWTDAGDEDDPSWVWKARAGAPFLHPRVVWAEVLLVD